ncbi:MAG TPA: UDP-N-acetylmuramate dehydrogenase, partial [Armatimonadetes bacterium]|nr:UDP-N-acetylmuramate dehydrogenase [Armatimonadota bacterium]
MRGTLLKELKERLKGSFLQGIPMSRLTSFRIGGEAELIFRPRDEEALLEALEILQQEGVPWRPLGGGTNLLVADGGVKGVLLDLRQVASFLQVEGARVRAGAGATLAGLLLACIEGGLSGLEPLAGIPGTIGGAVKGNAGSWGVEIGNNLRSITVLSLRGKEERRGEDLSFSYRRGPLEEGEVLWEAVFQLEEAEAGEIKAKAEGFLKERKRRQPMGLPSAGCIFKNPPGLYAGKLIEEVGLKGLRRGGAMISQLHANFIVNLGGATFGDV